jgi:hypothetical protein
MNHMNPQSWTAQQADIAERRERAEHKTIAAMLAALVFLFAGLVLAFDTPRQLECTTDAECAELCPADDFQCDGGPES